MISYIQAGRNTDHIDANSCYVPKAGVYRTERTRQEHRSMDIYRQVPDTLSTISLCLSYPNLSLSHIYIYIYIYNSLSSNGSVYIHFLKVITCTEGLWKDGIWEFDVTVPESYPFNPPKVRLSRVIRVYRVQNSNHK